MRQIVAVALLLTIAPSFRAHAAVGVVERPVSFTVVNQNRSLTAPLCTGDGKEYTVRGSLVGPASIDSGRVGSVTLYLHGGGDASTWHFTAVSGTDHVAEMARLGHASVFIHSLGYGPSDPVDGNSVCLGTYADMTHQIIEHLREGSYGLSPGRDGPPFARVALAAHSVGAGIAELETVSFHDADALIIAGWTDHMSKVTMIDDPPGPLYYTALAAAVQRCATAPEPKSEGGPGGWAHVFTTRSEFEALMPNAEPIVLDAFADALEQDPCGFGRDVAAAIATNIEVAPTVTIPVLLIYGDREPLSSLVDVEAQRARYAIDNDDVSVLVIPDAGHVSMLERPAPVLRSGVSHWLRARGF